MTDKSTFRLYQKSDRAWVMRENLQFYVSVHGLDASFAHASYASHIVRGKAAQTKTPIVFCGNTFQKAQICRYITKQS